jgi:hypothetical protein
MLAGAPAGGVVLDALGQCPQVTLDVVNRTRRGIAFELTAGTLARKRPSSLRYAILIAR